MRKIWEIKLRLRLPLLALCVRTFSLLELMSCTNALGKLEDVRLRIFIRRQAYHSTSCHAMAVREVGVEHYRELHASWFEIRPKLIHHRPNYRHPRHLRSSDALPEEVEGHFVF
jgi:hypothetical protein